METAAVAAQPSLEHDQLCRLSFNTTQSLREKNNLSLLEAAKSFAQNI